MTDAHAQPGSRDASPSAAALEVARELLRLRALAQKAGLATVALPPELRSGIASRSEQQLRAAATVTWEQPSDDLHLFGFGRAFDLGSAAGAPLASAARALREAADDLRVGPLDPLARPRFFGGARFDCSAPHPEPAWQEFGAWRFVLPEIIVARQGGETCVSLTLPVRPQQTREEVATAVEAAIAGVGAVPPVSNPQPHQYERSGPDVDSWRAAVTQALGEIDAGRYRKTVLSLRVLLLLGP